MVYIAILALSRFVFLKSGKELMEAFCCLDDIQRKYSLQLIVRSYACTVPQAWSCNGYTYRADACSLYGVIWPKAI